MWVDMVNLIKLAWLKHALNISNPVKKSIYNRRVHYTNVQIDS